MNDNNYTVFNAMTDIIASPGKALDHIKDHTKWLWVAVIINIALGSAAFAYYYSWVDFPWLIDETIRSIPPENRAEAEAGIRGFMSVTSSIAITVASLVFMSLVFYTIQAVYLLLVSKITLDGEIGFGQWFSLSAWANFVGIFTSIAIFIVIFMADSNQLAQNELTPLSFNALFIHAQAGDPWFNWANSTNLLLLWTIGLTALGISRWTGAGMVKAAIIAALPYVLIFGIWAALI